ncbi:ATP-binding protein [Streptomyces sp. LHD-70]|uniref:ATP-binding protein n=1 Tax=Streptomyces sp. LHD-70 TaxID=3072140 RepID=UPI00280F12E3|nr:ATP-binding protein [Streptomyces sp. LHD-70]MDQ8702166.1 ATP-binding protein [Streptomyces sp. LHD-70]
MPSRTCDETKQLEADKNQRPLSAAVERHSRQFTRRKANVPAARRFVAEVLTRWDHVQRLGDIRLCVSELVTNALLHAPVADGLILVRLELHSSHVLLDVEDGGDGTPAPRPAQEADDHGRGLLLVAALADAWGVTARHGPGKGVWATFRHSTSDGQPTPAPTPRATNALAP